MKAETIIQRLARFVIASEARQSILSFCCTMDCFASLAMTESPGNMSAMEQRV